MARRFDEHSTHATIALPIWLILISQASNRQTVTYRRLAEMVGFRGPHAVSPFLGPIRDYCRKNDLPPLTVLVVSENKGLPNAGLDSADLNADREAVFEFDWFSIFPPTPEELREAYRGVSS